MRSMVRLVGVVVVLFVGVGGSRAAVDIPVESEGDYQVMLDAIRAAEYTRQGYLEGEANPRMVCSIVGLWAFAEVNPLATAEQLDAFVVAYDAALASAVPGDERLSSAGSVLTALNAAVVPSDGVLAGTDTRVGGEAMALLGVSLPGLESFERSQQRMARFDVGSVQRWINRRETADALTGVLAGVSPSGERIVGLALAGAMYLESMGYAPMLGMIDAGQVEVNAGLAGLPDFAGFVAMRDDVGAHAALEGEVFAGIAAIQTDAGLILEGIGQAEIPSGLALDSVDLFAAAADPDDPDHAAAVAFLEARRQAVVDSIRETSDERASVFARTLLLAQSSYPDVVYVAENTRSFAGLQLQVNTELAVAQQSLGIVGSLAEIGAAYATGNVYEGMSSAAGLISGVLGLVDILGDGPPSADQQIFDQIAGLRQQVADLQVQMNERFDIVDAKLDVIFSTMVAAFDLLQNGIDTLIADLATVRGSLDRIEAALFGFAQNLLLVDLTAQTDAVLDYRAKTGFDLSYTDQSPSFVGASSGLTTFATFTAQTSVFAGPEDNQGMVLTLDNASDVLLGENDVVSRLLNDFRRVPAGLVTSGGVPVVGPIITGRTAAPAPWSQAAAAYAQLSRESPWYFAYMLQSQRASGGGNAPQIDQIIDQGERIALLASATRGREDLFNALLQRATDGLAVMQSLSDASVASAYEDLGLSGSGVLIDGWGSIDQVASPVAAPITSVVGAGSIDASGFAHRGYEMFFSDARLGESAGFDRAVLAERLAMLRATRPDRPILFQAQVQPNGGGDMTVIFRASNNAVPFVVERTIRFRVEYDSGTGWRTYTDFEPFSFYQQRLQQGWVRLGPAMGVGNLVGNSYLAGQIFVGNLPSMSRLRVLQDRSSAVSTSISTQAAAIETGLFNIRVDVRDRLMLDLQDPSGGFVAVSDGLADTRALLDGYLTLGVTDALNRSEILRSALRGLPSAGGMWLDSAEFAAVVSAAGDADTGSLGGPGVWDVPTLAAHFDQRVAALGSEIALAIANDAPSFPYVEFMLADLRSLRDNAFALAADDTYLVSGPASFDAAAGVMANDIGQPGRIDNQDLMVDLAFFGSPGQAGPSNGTVVVDPDGSFVYTPDAGFAGTDSFTYRLIAQVGDPANPIGDPNVVSDPATVVLRVSAASCPADFTGDGGLNFFDFVSFLDAFNAGDPAADFNGDGVLNFFDFPEYINAFNAGCP